MKAALFFEHMQALGHNVGAAQAAGTYVPSYRLGGELYHHYYGVKLYFTPRLTVGVIMKSRRALSARAAAELVASSLIPAMPKIVRALRKVGAP